MEIPVHERKEVIDRAKHLMKHYGYDALTSIQISEQEIEKQKKVGEKNE